MAAAKKEQILEVRAEAKWIRISPRKARVVAEHIRGRSVPEARTVLAFTQRAAAHEISKVLKSAVANAESRPDLLWNGDDLIVSTVQIDEGPTIKRWRARARGRVARIRKRTCHITIKVAQNPKVATRRPQPPAAPPEATAKPKRRTPKKKEVNA